MVLEWFRSTRERYFFSFGISFGWLLVSSLHPTFKIIKLEWTTKPKCVSSVSITTTWTWSNSLPSIDQRGIEEYWLCWVKREGLYWRIHPYPDKGYRSKNRWIIHINILLNHIPYNHPERKRVYSISRSKTCLFVWVCGSFVCILEVELSSETWRHGNKFTLFSLFQERVFYRDIYRPHKLQIYRPHSTKVEGVEGVTLGIRRGVWFGCGGRLIDIRFQDFSSRNITVANTTHNLRWWSVTPWWGLRLYMSAWVSVGLPSRLDRVFAHRIRGLLVCWPRLFL